VAIAVDTVALLAIAGGLCLLAAGAVGLLAGAIVVLASSVLGHSARVSPDIRNMANMADPGHMDPITGHLFREDEL
jgi:hypothetical protein